MWPPQTIELNDLDKSHMKGGGQLNKHICGKKSNLFKETAEIVNVHFSHSKSMGTKSRQSNQCSYPTGTKTQLFVLPTYKSNMFNMKRIGFNGKVV